MEATGLAGAMTRSFPMMKRGSGAGGLPCAEDASVLPDSVAVVDSVATAGLTAVPDSVTRLLPAVVVRGWGACATAIWEVASAMAVSACR